MSSANVSRLVAMLSDPKRRIYAGILSISLLFSTSSAAINIEVTQSNGEPAAGVVVTLSSDQLVVGQASAQEMGQRARQFDPHVLIVQKGATVSFPNYDNIKHHVYSFSAVKSFEQELYKGRESKPVTFEQAGVVELGCNVHDWMLGYIYVTESPIYGKTDEQGKLALPEVPDGKYDVTVWHPRLDNDSNSVKISADIAGTFNIALKDKIAEATDSASEFEFNFDEY